MVSNVYAKLAILLSFALVVLTSPQDYGSWKRNEHHRHQHHKAKSTKTSKTSAYTLTETSSSSTLQSSSASIHSYPTATGLASASGSALYTGTAGPSGKITPSRTATPSASATISTNSTVSTTSANSEFLRGINIGGWLLIEKALNGRLFQGAFADAVDQWTFDSISGASTVLESHYASYFNETHISLLKSYGINALRIPIGYWAYSAADTPYYSLGPGKGADAYLEKAISWAQAAGFKVWIDLHGHPGSQNGYDTSGHTGSSDWHTAANQAASLSILKTVAAKYGTAAYADTVIAIELVNEPLSTSPNSPTLVADFAKSAYSAVRDAAANKDLMIVMHDAFEGPAAWTTWANSEGSRGKAGIDTHMYQTLTSADNALTQAEHIAAACSRGIDLASVNEVAPFFVGEWSAATNVCFNSDGSSVAGTTCTTSGCACVSDPVDKWTDAVVTGVRKYVEAQLEVFEAYSSGYFLWAWTDPEGGSQGVGIVEGIAKGAIPSPIGDIGARKYMGQCLG